MTPLNLFYEEPDPDRWIKFDRYPRKIIRQLLRGKPLPGGVMMVALELMRGLDKLNIPYRFNDYKYAKQNPNELIGVIGKPQLIYQKRFKNPILFGTGIFSHPSDCPDLFEKYPNLKRLLVPGDWMEEMFEPFYPNKVEAWPVGIDTEKWNEKIKNQDFTVDFLIYDKIRWQHNELEQSLINPIIETLVSSKLSYETIKYGNYTHDTLKEKLARCKAVIFLCEHESQGLAYQQILATNTPIFAWDRGGYWQDPSYYPNRVQYKPVTSVPYWDETCGTKFRTEADFSTKLTHFLDRLHRNDFNPRNYILKNLTLEICAKNYLDIYRSLQ